jgi:VWFA-related protein
MCGRLRAASILSALFALVLSLVSDASSFQSSPPSAAAAPPAKEDVRFLALGKDGQPIADLKAEEVRIRINKTDRKVLSLVSAANEPRTIGLFLDASGSRREDKYKEKEVHSIRHFLESTWRAGDDGFAVAFNVGTRVLVQPTKDIQAMQDGLGAVASLQYYGSTALYDALCMPKRREDRTDRREAIYVVISDFEDNASKHSLDSALKILEKNYVRIFPILVEYEPISSKRIIRRANETAREFAGKTGGDVLMLASSKEIDGVFDRLADELRPEYSLMYEWLAGQENIKHIQLETSRRNVRLLYARP